ncbi:MAG: glycosyltransferase [Saprospiraceae bacterium]|nr:glycosyltransferase [Saprospiraceae bacterium]
METKIPFALLSNYNQETNGLPAYLYKKARAIFSKADKNFFISRRNLEVASRTLALPMNNAIELCNPLSSATTVYVPYPVCKIPVMCMVARLECDVKCQDLLLGVLAGNYWKGKEWVLNLYGEGPHKEYLEDLIQFYGMGNRVFLQGYRNTIEDIWAENQLLIMASTGEGTPISLLTALVAGRTAVVTNVGGCAEYVADNKTGFVAEVLHLIV